MQGHLSRLASRMVFSLQHLHLSKKLVRRGVNVPFIAAQPDERLKSVQEPSFFLLIGEPCQPAEMAPIATSAISSKPRGELARLDKQVMSESRWRSMQTNCAIRRPARSKRWASAKRPC